MGDITPAYIATVAVAYVPVAFVVFAEHLADHKNLSSIIGQDLLEEPGLKMIQKVDLNQNKNLFTVAAILIPGIGGMAMGIGTVYITTTACALILGIITNLLLSKGKED